MKRAVITVGMGFGDEGKGGSTEFLCRRLGADMVVRYSGGSQCAHNVETSDGKKHCFAQFGSGTLSGVTTFLGPQVIVNPPALFEEANHLQELEVADPFSLLYVHPECLVTTSWTKLLNQFRERARGHFRHGSCGHGIGETRHYWLKYGSDAIFAKDLLKKSVLRRKLELQRQRTLAELETLGESITVLTAAGTERVETATALDISCAEEVESLRAVGDWILLRRKPEWDTAVFEGAQGVLLDEWRGFYPHTTRSTVTPHHALEMTAGCDKVTVVGVTRAYTTRHGAGPLPTEDASLRERYGEHDVNPANEWQGELRWGWLDLVLLRYAARVVGKLDALSVTWLDKFDSGKVCTGYDGVGEIPLLPVLSLKMSNRIHNTLTQATPVYNDVDRAGLLAALGEIAPVRLTSYGMTYNDRLEDIPFFESL